MSKLMILKTEKVGLESLDLSDDMTSVRSWQVFFVENSTN